MNKEEQEQLVKDVVGILKTIFPPDWGIILISGKITMEKMDSYITSDLPKDMQKHVFQSIIDDLNSEKEA